MKKKIIRCEHRDNISLIILTLIIFFCQSPKMIKTFQTGADKLDQFCGLGGEGKKKRKDHLI